VVDNSVTMVGTRTVRLRTVIAQRAFRIPLL
jgi:hypothetical protein